MERGSYRQKLQGRRTVAEFEKLAVIGRGAFGEVRLVREISTQKILAMKMLKKSEMLKRNQVQHVRSERDLMASSEGEQWIVQLHCSFQDDEYLYLVMEFLPGGDMMTWLIQHEIFTEQVCSFDMYLLFSKRVFISQNLY
jgi:serine/threonine protein kinase